MENQSIILNHKDSRGLNNLPKVDHWWAGREWGRIGHLVSLCGVEGGWRPHCNARVMMSQHVQQPKDLPNTSLLGPLKTFLKRTLAGFQRNFPCVKLRGATAFNISRVERGFVSELVLMTISSLVALTSRRVRLRRGSHLKDSALQISLLFFSSYLS